MVVNDFALRENLFRKRITQLKIAEITGLSRNTVNAVCNGKSCSKATAEKIAAALGIELSEIEKQ